MFEYSPFLPFLCAPPTANPYLNFLNPANVDPTLGASASPKFFFEAARVVSES